MWSASTDCCTFLSWEGQAAFSCPVRLTESEARALAQSAYRGAGRPVSARFYEKPPQETGRETPLWRVDFDDAERTAFYLDPETGEVATRRSAVWRFYDFLWRLHILDLKNGEDFNNPLIIAARC